MEWCKEILEQVKFENISNEDEKKKIAQRIAQKVKDGEVSRTEPLTQLISML